MTLNVKKNPHEEIRPFSPGDDERVRAGKMTLKQTEWRRKNYEVSHKREAMGDLPMRFAKEKRDSRTCKSDRWRLDCSRGGAGSPQRQISFDIPKVWGHDINRERSKFAKKKR